MKRSAAKAAAVILCLVVAACGKKSAQPVSMLSEKDKKYVAETLAGMKSDVRLVLFSRDGRRGHRRCRGGGADRLSPAP